jgi:predicted ATPase
VGSKLPTGIVTLLFTDIEGSTRLLRELGIAAYSAALAEHRRLLRKAFTRHGGVEVDTQGDAFLYAFPDAGGALAAAQEGREALRSGRIHVRVGIHTGSPRLGPEGYVGEDVHLGARIGAAGHGGQVLLSNATRRSVDLEEGVLDLGEHRLKDFDRAVSIFQLGVERFPPQKTISNTNLPRPTSSFVGRGRDVDEIAALIRDGVRLVTLTGPGGSGKTRLAIETAAELVGTHKAGTFWVELATIRDPALVIEEISKTVGARDTLADHIGEREILVVLDNMEQVIETGPELADLVETCPNLTVLTTSRERLRVRGEVEYEVAPLAEPDAVELFVSRAGLTQADEAVHKLCRSLDEMPLAIELAAARAKVLGPAQILERVSQRLDLFTGGRDADPRQRSLRSTIEWSYDLLDPREQQLFARLAVFAGGATLKAAEHIVDADLDTLGSLVEKSLVRRTDDRYWMYETIREFAVERLVTSGEADWIRRRHAVYFLGFVEEAEPKVVRELLRRYGESAERLEAELDNIRAAQDLAEAEGDVEAALRIAGALGMFLEERGHIAESRRRLERALAAGDAPAAMRGKALSCLASAASLIGDLTEARDAVEEALTLHRALGDVWRMGVDSHTLAFISAESGDMISAHPLFEEGVRLLREAGDEDAALWVTKDLGWSYHASGDLVRARQIYETNLRRAREVGNRSVEAATLGLLGSSLVDSGRAGEAFPYLEQGYRLHRELNEPFEIANDVLRFAQALVGVGRAEESAQLLSLAAAHRENGTKVHWEERQAGETLAAVRAQLDRGRLDDAWERGKRLSPDAAVAMALAAPTEHQANESAR